MAAVDTVTEGHHRCRCTDESDHLCRLETYNRIIRSISSRLDLEQVAELVSSEIEHLLPHDRTSLALTNPREPTFTVSAVAGHASKWGVGSVIPIAGSTIGGVITSGEGLFKADIEGDPEFVASALLDQGIRSIVCVPLRDGDECFGTLNFGSFQAGAYGPDELSLAQEVAVLVIRQYREMQRLAEADRGARQAMDALIEVSPLPIIALDRDAKVRTWNPAAEAVFGWSEEEVVGKAPPVLASGEMKREFAQAMEGASFEGWKVRRQRSDGSPVDLGVWSAPVRDANGAVEGTIAVVADLTERKRLEAALRESERRYRTLVELTADVVYATDARGFFTYCNAAAEKMSGYSADELIGKHFTFLVAPRWKRRVQRFYLERSRNRAAEPRLEFPVRTRAGEERWAEQTVTLIVDDGTVTGFQGFVRDVTERKRAEEALRESEERYRSLYDNTPVMLVAVDQDEHGVGTITDVNKHWLKALGYERSEVLGRLSTDFLTEESRRYGLEVRAAEFARTGLAREVGYQMVKKNGDLIDVLMSAVAQRNEHGKATKALAFVIDITDRKRAEEALRKSEERYHHLVDRLPDPLFVHIDGKVAFANPAAARLLGVADPGNLIGRASADLVAPEYREAVAARFRELKDQGRVMTAPLAESMVYNGERKNVEVTIIPFELQGKSAVQTVIRDVTDRKRAEEALRKSEERYRVIYDSLSDGVARTELGGTITDANPAFARMLGYDLEELRGKTIEDITVPAYHDEERRRIRSAVMGESGPPLEKEYVRKDGERVSVEIRGTVERDAGGEPMGLVAVVTDITERKRAQQAMRELAVVEERNRFAREIHDTLAQSLTGIVVQLGLAMSWDNGDRQAGYPQIRSAQALAKETLDDARRSVWNLRPRSLEAASLSEAIRQEIARAEQEGFHISLEVIGEPPESIERSNELAAFRIVQEALSNVRRHAGTSTAAVRISFGATDVLLQISDEGVGFDPTAPLGTLSSSGGGFGLTSMQERARMADGSLEVHSGPDVGTRVEARIPYVTDEEDSQVQTSPSDSTPRQQPTSKKIGVLIVDDHPLVRQGIRSMLDGSDDFAVAGEAEDGEQALGLIETLKPEVVLMDIQMPVLDGVQAVRRLQELGLKTRVLLLSVYAKDDYIVEGLRAGARGYLLKDVGRDDLMKAIRTVHEGGSLLPPVTARRLIERLSSEPGPQLTHREIDVLRLLSAGARNQEIAQRLTISVNTTKYHLENIYRKLGVQTRTEAARFARETGVLD